MLPGAAAQPRIKARAVATLRPRPLSLAGCAEEPQRLRLWQARRAGLQAGA